MEKKEISKFVEKFMKTYEPDTFIPNKHGQYIYRSENLASGINLVAFFEELLEEYAQSHQVEMPSDEEIMNVSKEFHKVHGGYHPDFGRGAKWFKSQIK